MIGGYSDAINEEVTPRKPKKLRVLGESDGEFTRNSTDADDDAEESDDAVVVDPNELATAKARSGGRGMIQTSPAAKNPAKIPPPKNKKKTSSVQMRGSKRVPQANETPTKTAKQTQPPKKAVKQGRPPKDSVKQDPAPRAPIAKKPTNASRSASAGDAILKDSKKSTAQSTPRNPKVMAAASGAPSNGPRVQVSSSEIVSRSQPPNKKNTSVRIVTVAPNILESQANPSGGALTWKSKSSAKPAPKVAVQQTTPIPGAVTGKRPRPLEPVLVHGAKRSRGSTTPRSDSELTEYMSASEDP